MLLLRKLKENRLKINSVLAVSADVLMGLAGGVSLFFWDRAESLSDISLMIASAFALSGHGALFIWGKGGEIKNGNEHSTKTKPELIKTLRPWHYPLDWAFSNFILAAVMYGVAGFAAMNIPMIINGILSTIASVIGWLCPQDKLILGFRSIQVTAMIYAASTLFMLIAGLVAQNGFIVVAACAWLASCLILYTVRKENQSKFSQES